MAEIATSTRIPFHYLQAIEGDDRRTLPPGGFFYRSFVRQYAAELGIKDREIEAELERMVNEEAPPPMPGQEPRLEKPPKVPSLDKVSWAFAMSPTLRSLLLLVVVVAGCSGFYSWWKKASREKPPEVVAAVPRRHVQRTVPKATPDRPSTSAAPSVSTSAIAATEKKPIAGGAAQPPSEDHIELSLQAIEATWLSVALDGKPVFSGLLQPNEVKTVDGQEVARLRLGNAGGVQVRWNGREVGPFGARGQVRTVVFTRDKYEVVPPKPAGDATGPGDSAENDITQ